MKPLKTILQAFVTVAALALPAAASAQGFPFPTSYGPYGPMLGPISGSGLFGDAFDGTPLDPMATTVHVVPPTGGTVMLYRNGDVRGWWMAPGVITVQPDEVYNLVATRGTQLVFASGIVFRPGFTEIAWQGAQVPAIAYQPAWYLMGTGEPPWGRHHQERFAEHRGGAHDHDGHEPARAEEHADHTERAGEPAPLRGTKVVKSVAAANAKRLAAAASKQIGQVEHEAALVGAHRVLAQPKASVDPAAAKARTAPKPADDESSQPKVRKAASFARLVRR